jgi:Leucine-rich repeat (LRR) protein
LQVIGDHIGSRKNEDVEGISFNNLKIYQIPRNIHRFFSNLKTLTISSCGLKNISKQDFFGLKLLKHLTLNGNLIASLPNNLFENTPVIEAISMYGNKIELIGPNVFDSLKNLKYVNLKMNVNIDVCCKDYNGTSIEQLKTIINENCQPKVLVEISDFFDFEDIKIFDESHEILEDYSFLFEEFDISCHFDELNLS